MSEVGRKQPRARACVQSGARESSLETGPSVRTMLLVIFPLLIGMTACERRPEAAPLVSPAAAEEPTFDPATARVLAFESRNQTDSAAANSALEESIRRAPSMVDALLLLAARRVEQGDVDGAFAALQRLSDLGVRAPIDRFEPLQPLAGDARWAELLHQLDAHLTPAGGSQLLFELDEKDLLTEGLAHDSVSDSWYVSAVHGRKILRIAGDGEVEDFVAGDDIWAVFGMAVDEARRKLWATTAVVPQMKGFDPALAPATALLEIDLIRGDIVARYELLAAPGIDPPQAHRLNDVAVAADGTVYVSDLLPPGGIYRLAPGGTGLERIAENLPLNSPQGLVLLDDDSLLLLADYSLGLEALDLESGRSWFVEPPEDLWLQALDGLARAGADELVAIQNGGYPPHRILYLRLSDDRRHVTRWQIAARALPDWREPTLGVVAHGSPRRFVYVAASQWPLFPEGSLPDPSLLERPRIMSVDLDSWPGDAVRSDP